MVLFCWLGLNHNSHVLFICKYTNTHTASYRVRLSLNTLGQGFHLELRVFQQYLGVNSPINKRHLVYARVNTMTTKAKSILRELVQSLHKNHSAR